ncbi:MAG: hypothetical protein LUH21_04335 [Clostridiales bacterium]|nr:hypothetical protein [Clostridiales bacterium]
MNSRIIVIFNNEDKNNYWYEIDKCLMNKNGFYEAQERSGQVMHISEGDDIYLLCKYKDHSEIKYKCKVVLTDIPFERLPKSEKNDLYAHNECEDSTLYFKARLIEIYEDGTFPESQLRDLGFIKSTRPNGNIIREEFLSYINNNKKVVMEF